MAPGDGGLRGQGYPELVEDAGGEGLGFGDIQRGRGRADDHRGRHQGDGHGDACGRCRALGIPGHHLEGVGSTLGQGRRGGTGGVDAVGAEGRRGRGRSRGGPGVDEGGLARVIGAERGEFYRGRRGRRRGGLGPGGSLITYRHGGCSRRSRCGGDSGLEGYRRRRGLGGGEDPRPTDRTRGGGGDGPGHGGGRHHLEELIAHHEGVGHDPSLDGAGGCWSDRDLGRVG